MLICCYFGLRITVPSPSTVSTLILSHCTGQKVIKNDMKIKIKEKQSLQYSRYHNTVNTTSINPNSPTMLYSGVSRIDLLRYWSWRSACGNPQLLLRSYSSSCSQNCCFFSSHLLLLFCLFLFLLSFVYLTIYWIPSLVVFNRTLLSGLVLLLLSLPP